MAKNLYHVIPTHFDHERGYRVTTKESYYNLRDDIERMEARTSVKPTGLSDEAIDEAVKTANAILEITGETDYFEYR